MKSTRKHTPGPWSTPHFAAKDCTCKCGYVLVDGYCGSIATVHYSGDRELKHGDHPPPGEAIANARLIAAAPDLLEVMGLICREAESWHTMHGHDKNSVQCDSICALIPKMQAVIRKAGMSAIPAKED